MKTPILGILSCFLSCLLAIPALACDFQVKISGSDRYYLYIDDAPYLEEGKHKYAYSLVSGVDMLLNYIKTHEGERASIKRDPENSRELTIWCATEEGDVTDPTPDPDPDPLAINNFSLVPSDTGATVTWTTNLPANTAFDYGLDESMGTFLLDSAPVTEHKVTMENLEPGTVYYYRYSSKTPAGDLIFDREIKQFTTTGTSQEVVLPLSYDYTPANGPLVVPYSAWHDSVRQVVVTFTPEQGGIKQSLLSKDQAGRTGYGNLSVWVNTDNKLVIRNQTSDANSATENDIEVISTEPVRIGEENIAVLSFSSGLKAALNGEPVVDLDYAYMPQQPLPLIIGADCMACVDDSVDLIKNPFSGPVNVVLSDTATLSISTAEVLPQPVQVYVQWDAPNTRENGATLSPEEIAQYRLDYGLGQVRSIVNYYDGTASSAEVELSTAGEWSFQMYTIDTTPETPCSEANTPNCGGPLVSQGSEVVSITLPGTTTVSF